MTTTAALPPTIQTAEPIRPRAAAVRADWNTADEFDVEKGTMGGYAQAATEDLTFSDLVDLINPLQHIPGVSQVYRALTGDTIKPAVKVMGGLVFGGPAGLMLGAGGAVVDSMLGDPLALPIRSLRRQHCRIRQRWSRSPRFPRRSPSRATRQNHSRRGRPRLRHPPPNRRRRVLRRSARRARRRWRP